MPITNSSTLKPAPAHTNFFGKLGHMNWSNPKRIVPARPMTVRPRSIIIAYAIIPHHRQPLLFRVEVPHGLSSHHLRRFGLPPVVEIPLPAKQEPRHAAFC